MTLVIMAAGMGSRYGGLKQIDPVGAHSEFILDYSIYDAIAAGFRKVVLIIKEEHLDDFRDTIGRRIERAVPVEYVFQKLDALPAPYTVPDGRTKPWGTAHAVLAAADAVDEPFAVINADDFYGRDAFVQLGHFLQNVPRTKPDAYCMAGYVLKNTLTENGYVSRGVCSVDGSGKLTSVTERTKIQRNDGTVQFCEGDVWTALDENCTVSMNCWGFTPAIFDAIRRGMDGFFAQQVAANPLKAEYYLPSVVTQEIEAGRCSVQVLKTDARWYGVTYPADKPTVVRKLAEMTAAGVYPDGLWQ